MGGGEADGFGLVDVGGLGGGEPGVELGEGGGGELGAFQGAFCVLVCLLGGFVAGRRNLDPRISMVLEGCEVGNVGLITDEFGGGVCGGHASISEEVDRGESHMESDCGYCSGIAIYKLLYCLERLFGGKNEDRHWSTKLRTI